MDSLLMYQVLSFILLDSPVLLLCKEEHGTGHEISFTHLKVVGCFEDNHDYFGLLYNVTNSSGIITAESCVELCLQQFFRYAFLKNAEECYCNSSYGRFNLGFCSKLCERNDSQSCNNYLSNVVFDTGQQASGPPASLELYNATSTSVQAAWKPPIAQNDIISGYIVLANSINTYSTVKLSPRQWMFPNSTSETELPELHPGTEYNISVAAHSEHRNGAQISAIVWTEIGEPVEPKVPNIVKRDKGQIIIELTPAMNDNGPITAYHIVVIYEAGLVEFRKDMLKSFQEAESEGLSYYIAAELDPKDLKNEFVVGDGRTYGKYYNPPLPLDSHIHVTVGVVSSLNNVTKVSYALLDPEQHDIVIFNVGDNTSVTSSGISGLVLGLSVAIGVCGFFLILLVVAYFMLRSHLGRRRHNMDHQELSVQGPLIEVEPSGYIHNGFVPEEEEERVNHYENLKRQVWNIPRNFLDVKSERLGTGKYGNVMKGTVQQRGFPVAVAVYTIADGELPPKEKRLMLQDLGTTIGLGSHANVASFIGMCESPENLYIVVEHHPASLKDVLLESRILEHSSWLSSSDAGHSQRQVSSLSESQVLEIALGIARAMDYLHCKKVLHKQLAARNVLMADGVMPKISGHGITSYIKCNENPDYTRWTAQEIFRSRPYVNKSDVWSFGCVLWEMVSLGGTPYAGVSTSEIPGRVMRGQRLPQLQLVDDDLYQMMLQCWQMDLDERPTFQEITQILENMLKDSTIHLNFKVYAGFHYEQYLHELEEIQP